MTTSRIIVGILGAAAAGVMVGMLIAPEKGSEMRKNIKKTTDDWMDEVNNLIGQGKEMIDKVTHKTESKAKEMEKKASKVEA